MHYADVLYCMRKRAVVADRDERALVRGFAGVCCEVVQRGKKN